MPSTIKGEGVEGIAPGMVRLVLKLRSGSEKDDDNDRRFILAVLPASGASVVLEIIGVLDRRVEVRGTIIEGVSKLVLPPALSCI
jgi:hypothetical protein